MVVDIQNFLNPISIVLNVPVEKNIESNGIRENAITSTIFNLLDKSKSILSGDNNAEKAEIQQWIEYCTVYVAYVDSSQNCTTILSTLNDIFATKTYLVAQKITIADVLLYYILQNVFDSLSHVEKERYMHVSRWFDNIQQHKAFKHSNKLIDFRTNYVATLVPSKH